MKPIFSSACVLSLLTGCAGQMHDSDSAAVSPTYFRSQVETPSASDAALVNAQEAMALRQLALQRQQEQGTYSYSTDVDSSSTSGYPGTGSISYMAPGRPEAPPPQQQPERPAPPQVGERVTGPAPLATPVAGKPGYVLSPFAPQAGYVDVTGLAPGTEAKDPYTGKVFRVP
jgi:hypothetical protein